MRTQTGGGMRLTDGERFLLDRRRRGETQTAAASRLGLSRYLYRNLEVGATVSNDVPNIEPEVHEWCFILRRRNGRELRDLAREIGVSAWWLCQMEHGKVTTKRLVEFWRDDLPDRV